VRETFYALASLAAVATLLIVGSIKVGAAKIQEEQERLEVGRNAGAGTADGTPAAHVKTPPKHVPARRAGIDPTTHGDSDVADTTDLHLYLPPDEAELFAGILKAYELDEECLPTEAGLLARTLGLWGEDQDFLSLTADQARGLLGPALPKGYSLSGQATAVSSLGGLPTADDVRRGFQDDGVRHALERYQSSSVIAAELSWEDPKTSTRQSRAVREVYARAEIYWRDRLMAELERATGYDHWTLLARLWAAWER